MNFITKQLNYHVHIPVCTHVFLSVCPSEVLPVHTFTEVYILR